MHKKIKRMFNYAAELAVSKEDDRAFLLSAVAIRYDGAIVGSSNSSTELPFRMAHAEYRLAKKLDKYSSVYVVRIRLLDGSFAMARPCKDCQKVLRFKNVEKVYYTISHNQYGKLNLKTGVDSYYFRY